MIQSTTAYGCVIPSTTGQAEAAATAAATWMLSGGENAPFGPVGERLSSRRAQIPSRRSRRRDAITAAIPRSPEPNNGRLHATDDWPSARAGWRRPGARLWSCVSLLLSQQPSSRAHGCEWCYCVAFVAVAAVATVLATADSSVAGRGLLAVSCDMRVARSTR